MKKIALGILISLVFAAVCPGEEADDSPLILSQGATAAWLTRIIFQDNRSNFVFRDFLPGVYVAAELRNIDYFVTVFKLTAFYPLNSTFNNMVQRSNNPLHLGVDLFAGIRFELLARDNFRLNAGPGLRLFYLTADRWNYLNLGAAATAGVDLPLTERWTLLLDGSASIYNSNLGSNRSMEPFDIAWQYQAGIGVRYSTKMLNVTPIFVRDRQAADSTPANEEGL